MSTPALDRATEALLNPGVMLPNDSTLRREILARATVSAALHDPSDPDALARGLYDEMRKGTITPPWEEAHPTTQESFRYQARCFVTSILGEAS